MNSFATIRSQKFDITGKRGRGSDDDEYYQPSKRVNMNSEPSEMTRIFNIIRTLEQQIVMCEFTIKQQNQRIEEQQREIIALQVENQRQQEVIDNNKNLSKLNKRRHDNVEVQMSSALEYIAKKKNEECPDFTGHQMITSSFRLETCPYGDDTNILAYTN